MPKKQNPLTPEEQRKRFEEEIQRLEDAGELDRAAAEAALNKLVSGQKVRGSNPKV